MKDNFSGGKILAREAALVEAMIAVEEEATPLLLAGDAEALLNLNSRKEKLIFAMKELEQLRRDIFPRGFTLREFISKENPADARELVVLRDRLQALQVSLRRRQKINRNLLQNNLRFVESVLHLLSPDGEGPLYASGGDIQVKSGDSPAAVLLDDQA